MKKIGFMQFFFTNTYVNIFGVTKKVEYKYKYILSAKKANTNKNLNIFTDIRKYK